IWRRSGAGPEIEQVTFEKSTDGLTYTPLGNGTLINGGWQLAGFSTPVAQNFYLRARGRATGGLYNGSGGLIESVREFYAPAPRLINPIKLSNGSFQFSFTNLSGAGFKVLAATNLSLPSSNWVVLGSPVALAGSLYQFTDPNAGSYPRRFYRLRWP